MPPLLELLGITEVAYTLLLQSIPKLGLLCFFIVEFFLYFFYQRYIKHIFDSFEVKECLAIGIVVSWCLRVILINSFVISGVHLFYSALVSWILVAMLPLIFEIKYRKRRQPSNSFELNSWILPIFIFGWSSFIILLSGGDDFAKFHFPLSKGILESNLLPGQDFFPVPFMNEAHYHYGPNLISASISSLFTLDLWVTDDLLPLLVSWTLYVGFYMLGKSVFKSSKTASYLALIAFLGSNIRLFWNLFLTLIFIFSAQLYQGGSWESLRLATSDYNLNISVFLTQAEVVLLVASQLGLPIFIFLIAIWTRVDSEVDKKNAIYISLPLLCCQPLFREDLFGAMCLSLLLICYFNKKLMKRIIFLLTISTFCALFLGGVIHGVAKSYFGVPIELSHAQEIAKGMDDDVGDMQNNENVYSGSSWSFVPSLGTLSITSGRVKVPVYHPQLLLDLILDFGLALIGLFLIYKFIAYVDLKKWLPFLLPIGLYFFIALFIDHPFIHYKLDIQRIINYNLFVWFGFASLVIMLKKDLRPIVVYTVIASSVLAGVSYPAKLLHDWNWYSESYVDLGAQINEDSKINGKSKYVMGINPGFTGLPSFAYDQDFNLIKKVSFWELCNKVYTEGNIDEMKRLNVGYVVYPLDRIPESFRSKDYWITEVDFNCYKID